ncbi:MAG: hypothetical protein E7399_09790, partial [Ruminococcaceae bacterium]|nr:hypothetical protein [Oscillospiraceae bacterium]
FDLVAEMIAEMLAERGVALFPEQAASFLTGILFALVLYFGSKLLLLLLSTVLDGVVRLPLLKQVNRLTGALLGATEAAVLIFGVLTVLQLVNAPDLILYEWIEESVLTKALYEYNPLMIFFAGK